MKLSKQQMQESGMVDYVTLLGAVEEIKRSVNSAKLVNNYSVLLFDNVYMIIDYNNQYINHECPSRYSMFLSSDFVFRIISNKIQILKSRMPIDDAHKIFEKRGIMVHQTSTWSHIDEE